MPELPEVEAARRALHDNCCNLVIVKASVADDSKVIDGVSSAALENALTGRRILGALRKGKNLWLQLDKRPWPSFQFGMSGAIHIKGMKVTKYKRSAVNDEEEWPSKFSKVVLELDNGLEVAFTDKRRFARVRLLDDPVAVPPISELGPDALLELPEETEFVSNLLKKRGSIKGILLDQSFLAGIGNWVADEVLFQARIHPEQTASNLSEEECKVLHKCIIEVIKLSVEVDADSERFPKTWIFHYRWDRKAGKIDGKKIEFITVGGRTSAYVPELQSCSGPSPGKTTGAARKKSRKDQSVDTEGLGSDETCQKNKESGKSKKSGRKMEVEPVSALEIEDDGNIVKKEGSQRKKDRGGMTEKSMQSPTAETAEKTGKERESKKREKGEPVRNKNKAEDEIISDMEKNRGRHPKPAKQETSVLKQSENIDTLKEKGRSHNANEEEQAEQEKHDAVGHESAYNVQGGGNGDAMDVKDHPKEMVAGEMSDKHSIPPRQKVTVEPQRCQVLQPQESNVFVEREKLDHTTGIEVIQQYKKIYLRGSLRLAYPLKSPPYLSSQYTDISARLSFVGQGGMAKLLQKQINLQKQTGALPCVWNISKMRHFHISHVERLGRWSHFPISRSGMFCCNHIFLKHISFLARTFSMTL